MQTADLVLDVERQIVAAEQEFENVKAKLFNENLSREQFARRRAYAREIEAWLGDLHEVRRKVGQALCGGAPASGDVRWPPRFAFR